jgi:chorismate synthase
LGTILQKKHNKFKFLEKTLKLIFLIFKLNWYFCLKLITMAGNSYGTLFRITTFGESHGEALGGIIDGCPPGITLDLEAVQLEMSRRKPGQSAIVTQRKEPDDVQFLSGIFEGKTTGTPIGFVIPNTNQKSDDYSHIKDNYRPSHADYVYDQKYGFRDYRGGGRSSARETASRVVAGAIAKQMLPEIKINAFVSSVGHIHLDKNYQELDFSKIESNPVRCPDEASAAKMEEYIREIRKQGDTVGGVVSCVIQNVPVGLGEPVFDKLHAELGKAMLSINAVKGFEYGSGFCGAEMKGSDHNDLYHTDGTTKTNLSGGIQGGISNGMDIYFRVAFKPVATIMQKQESLDNKGNITEMTGKGRHDPCVVPRAVPIVEAMAAIVLADFYLLNKIY